MSVAIRVATLLAVLGTGCVNRFEAPYATPDYVAVPRSSHTVRLEALGGPGTENCITANWTETCVVGLRVQLERAIVAMLHNVGIEASPADYVVRLDELTFRLGRTRAGYEVSLGWHVVVEDSRTDATMLAAGDTETATGNQPLVDLIRQVEHDAVVAMESAVGDLLSRI